MFRAVAFLARLVRALLAFAVLAGFTAGVPWLLVASAGWPLDWIGWPDVGTFPGLADLASAVTSPWSDQMVFGLLASIGWVLWVQFLRDTIIEIIEASTAASAARRGLPRAPVGRRGPIRWVAAVLVGAIIATVLFDAARTVTGTSSAKVSAADAAARNLAVAVAPAVPTALPAGYVITNPGPRSAVTVPAEPITRASVVTADQGGVDVPAWARDTPGGTHPVVEGDNLWDIAEATLGDPYRWREIYKLNRGHVQANGYALTDPDEIHVGWVLALPARESAPAPANPAPDGPAPTAPAPGAPGTTEPAPGGPSATPSGPPSAPPASATPAPSTAAPSTPAPGASGSSTPAPSGAASSPSAPAEIPAPGGTTGDANTQQHDDGGDDGDEAGIALPAEGWISLGLAAAIAAVAALLRLQRRRRARLTPAPVSTAPQPAPLPPSLAAVDAVGSRHLGLHIGPDSDAGYRPAGPGVPAPIGVDADGAEVSLFTLPGAGIAVHGDGAIPAARATLASVLSTGATDAVDARPVVVTTGDLLARLLPEGAPVAGLDPDGTAYDGERLLVLADTAAAVTHFEEEMIGRRRLLDTFDVDTITDLNTRTDHAERQPPYVLLIEATDRHAARLRAIATHRAALDLHPVIIGTLDGFPTVEITADGAVTVTGTDDEASLARWATLGAADLAAVLGTLTDVLARPEAGSDVDDPPAEPARATASTEPAEPVPAQPGDASALVRLRVLGPVTVATDAGPIATGMRSGSYTALALLAAHPAGRTLEQLAAALHPDTDKDFAVKRVRTDITTARRVLRAATGHDKPWFVVYDQTTGRYRIDPDTVAVDLWQMLTAIEHANTAARDRDADADRDGDTAVLAALRQAAELYGGDFADGDDRAWALDYATTYRHQILTVYARIAELLEADHPDQAVAALETAVELDPVNEELYQRIMRIHGRQHRPDAVRRTLRRLEERLADLGDAEPSQATRRVAERQLRPAAPVSGGQR